MKVGDLVVWDNTWGMLDQIYQQVPKCYHVGVQVPKCYHVGVQVTNGVSGCKSTVWLHQLKEGVIVEVNTNKKISQEEMLAIQAAYSMEYKRKLLKRFAQERNIKDDRLLGFGLLENGEIIYTKVVEAVEK